MVEVLTTNNEARRDGQGGQDGSTPKCRSHFAAVPKKPHAWKARAAADTLKAAMSREAPAFQARQTRASHARGPLARPLACLCAGLLLAQTAVSAAGESPSYETLLLVEDPAALQSGQVVPTDNATDDEIPSGFTKPDERERNVDQGGAPEGEALQQQPQSVFKTWWFWTLAGAVVTGTVVAGILATSDGDPVARGCEASVNTCFGDGT